MLGQESLRFHDEHREQISGFLCLRLHRYGQKFFPFFVWMIVGRGAVYILIAVADNEQMTILDALDEANTVLSKTADDFRVV